VAPKAVEINRVLSYWGGGRDAHSSHQDPVTLVDVQVLVRKKSFAGFFPNQSNDGMVEHIEREVLAEVSTEIRMEEVESPLEEIPSVVKLDAPQLGEVVLSIFGAKCIVGSCCH